MSDLKSARLQLVISPSEIVEIDDWRRGQSDLPNRSEAIRRLVKAGLQAQAPAKKKPARE